MRRTRGMQIRTRWTILIVIAVLLIVAFGVRFFLSAGEARNPVGPVQFDLSGVAMGSIPSRPNQIAVFSAPLDSSSSLRIRILGVQLIPFPGYPTPKLMHVALLATNSGYPTGTTGWPPGKGSDSLTFSIKKLKGAVIDVHYVPSGLRLLSVIVYGVSGDSPGIEYANLGLRVKYAINSKTYSADVFNGGLDCVENFRVKPSKSQVNHCDQVLNTVSKSQGDLTIRNVN